MRHISRPPMSWLFRALLCRRQLLVCLTTCALQRRVSPFQNATLSWPHLSLARLFSGLDSRLRCKAKCPHTSPLPATACMHAKIPVLGRCARRSPPAHRFTSSPKTCSQCSLTVVTSLDTCSSCRGSKSSLFPRGGRGARAVGTCVLMDTGLRQS